MNYVIEQLLIYMMLSASQLYHIDIVLQCYRALFQNLVKNLIRFLSCSFCCFRQFACVTKTDQETERPREPE